MVIKSIPFQIWKKTIFFFTYFFFAIAVLSPFLGLFFYVFETDFDYIVPPPVVKQKIRTTQAITSLPKKEKKTFIPIPNISNNLKFTEYNYRPDCKKNCQNLVCLSLADQSVSVKIGEKIYLDCQDFENPTFSKEKTPYWITPFEVKDDKLNLSFGVTYTSKDHHALLQNEQNITLIKSKNNKIELSKISKEALERLKKATYLPFDALISLLGGENFSNKKNINRLYFDTNNQEKTLFIKSGDFLCFEKGSWVKANVITTHSPLFKVESVNSSDLKGTFWNENGFFKEEISFNIAKAKSNFISNFSFDKIYQRNKESVICKIGNKTFVLKQNDWLIKKGDAWSHLVDMEEFNDLINAKIAYDIIIFDQIKSDKENQLFIGYIFDQSRSNYKKLEILLKKNEDLR
jgi:hypothetical protein